MAAADARGPSVAQGVDGQNGPKIRRCVVMGWPLAVAGLLHRSAMPPRAVASKRGEHTYMPTSTDSEVSLEPPEETGAYFESLIDTLLIEFDDADIEPICVASGIDDPVLHQVYPQARQPPAFLLDTVERFRLDREIRRFIEHPEDETPAKDADVQRYLQQVGLQLIWPTSRVLQLFEAGAANRVEYPQDSAEDLPRISVSEAQLMAGDLWISVLNHLDDEQIREWLGGDYASAADRLLALRRKAGEALARRRNEVFDICYQFRQQSGDPRVRQVRRFFADLPTSMVRELIARADEDELRQLSTAQVAPPRMLRDALWYRQQLRLNRAYEGLYLASAAGEDSDVLVLHTLETLPCWPGCMRIEVRQDSPAGALLDSIGLEQAELQRVLVRADGCYRVYNGLGQSLAEAVDMVTALRAALPKSVRRTLDMPLEADASVLRALLVDHTPLPRVQLLAALGMTAVSPPVAAMAGLSLPSSARGLPSSR